MKNALIPVIIAMFAIVSCTKEETIYEAELFTKSAEIKEIYVKNGILHIKDESVFWKITEINSTKTTEEILKWQDSLGFESFLSVYETIFTEYEDIIGGKNPIEKLEQFRADYKDYVIMATGSFDGLPDYSIKPIIDMLYLSVANAEGYVNIDGKLIDTKSIIKLKSVDSCYKSTSSRRMWIDVNRFSNGNIASAYVTHQKKVLFAWVSYKTQYYWELENPPYGYWYTNGDVSSGYTIAMPTGGTKYLKMWNRGVGDTNYCVFLN